MESFDILSTVIDFELFNDLMGAEKLPGTKKNITVIEDIMYQRFFSVVPNKRMNAYDALECIVIKSLCDHDFHFQHSLCIGNFVVDEVSSYIDNSLYAECFEIRFSEVLQIVRDVTSSLSIIYSDTVVSAVEAWLFWLTSVSSSHDEAYMVAA